MCGIVGVFDLDEIDLSVFKNRLNKINHRGPDDHGTWVREDKRLVLGSKRLAIQDISANGQMPMLSEDNRYVIVFNGEIYNYHELKKQLLKSGFKFRSSSDTEVVLYAYMHWGDNFLSQLNGMFALAIYDCEKDILLLSRDRAGEKPLYYWAHENGFVFGSELKTIFSDSRLERRLDTPYLSEYFTIGYVSGENTLVKGVKKLLPGNKLIYSLKNGEIEISHFWKLPEFQSDKNYNEKELVDRLDILLSGAVKRQMISDVPLGVLLSGGIDSSLITAYAAEHSAGKLKTFHISFDGFGKLNESPFAKRVSEYFDTEHVELSGNELEFSMIDKVLNFCDEPLADSSLLPSFLVSELTRRHVTVALGGDGGDELFGGYNSYQQMLKMDRIKKQFPEKARNILAMTAGRLPVGLKGRNYLLGLEGDIYKNLFLRGFFDTRSLSMAINEEYLKSGEFHKHYHSQDFLGLDLIQDITRHDFKNYLVNDILVKVDRTSMAHSLELRSPFLDYKLVEFAFSRVPTSMKVSKNERKILIKRLASKKLPNDLDLNRKQGFSIPLDSWIKDRWHQEFQGEIDSMDDHLFHTKGLKKMLRNTKSNYTNASKLFAVIILHKWMRKYDISH